MATTPFLDVSSLHLTPFPLLFPSLTVFPNAAGVLTIESSYTVGVTIEIGADLGLDLDEVVSAGVSVSVATSEETGVAEGAQMTCPVGPWKCALIITPQIAHVTGNVAKWDDVACSNKDPAPYTVDFPTNDSNGLPTGALVDICACPNFPSSTDPGAPSTICPQNCIL